MLLPDDNCPICGVKMSAGSTCLDLSKRREICPCSLGNATATALQPFTNSSPVLIRTALMVRARDDLGPVFQDWRPRTRSDFDIQVLDPCGADVRAALRRLSHLVLEPCNRLKVETNEFRNGVLAVS